MLSSKLLRLGALACAFVMVTAVSAQAYTIDLFTGDEVATVIDLNDPNPALVKATNVDILGGERDLLIEEIGRAHV